MQTVCVCVTSDRAGAGELVGGPVPAVEWAVPPNDVITFPPGLISLVTVSHHPDACLSDTRTPFSVSPTLSNTPGARSVYAGACLWPNHCPY